MNTPQSFKEFGNNQNLKYVAMATVDDKRAKAYKMEGNFSNVLSSQNTETKPVNRDGQLKDIINKKGDNNYANISQEDDVSKVLDTEKVENTTELKHKSKGVIQKME